MSRVEFESGQPAVQQLNRTQCHALLNALASTSVPLLRIDLSGVADKAATMNALGTALGLPDYFGGNLDALSDCLTDPDYAPKGILLLEGLVDRPGLMREDLLDVFEEAVTARAASPTPFRVFWTGTAD